MAASLSSIPPARPPTPKTTKPKSPSLQLYQEALVLEAVGKVDCIMASLALLKFHRSALVPPR